MYRAAWCVRGLTEIRLSTIICGATQESINRNILRCPQDTADDLLDVRIDDSAFVLSSLRDSC